MLVPVARLLARLRGTDDVAAVRRRLAAEHATAEHALAARVRELKVALARATGDVTSCGSCARGKPWPRGAYAGGDCCSGVTTDLFSEDEVAALAQAGTRPRDLVRPPGDQAGCAFRGPTSCVLAVEHRPTPCVRYACDGLRRELHRHGRLDEAEALAQAVAEAFAAFVAARAARLDDELLADPA